MNTKTMQFELDKKSLKMKDILNKEFVEIEVYAISDAYPNRNGSVFPLESMQNALSSFANKPILGAWDTTQNDFKSHNCNLEYDGDLETMYYDYTRPGCETPLGMIRESDKVEIVYDEERKENWIVVHAVLWSRYAYNQIKKLLRKNGKSKISVEIEVEESHEDENGYEILDKFNFTGLTILGTENGKPVEEGIENAHLNILELMGNSLFQQKQKALAFAYSALDNYNSKQKVETLDKNITSTQDSNIEFSKNKSSIDNEEIPQVSMEEKVNQEGGIPAMQLTMRAKIELLQVALEKALFGEDNEENYCCYVWVMDICEKYVYFETGNEKFRCPYAITELGEEREVALDLSAKERVVSSWSVFSAEENAETQKEEFDHDGEGEGHKCIECTIRDLIIDEEEAIQGYSHAEKHFEEEYPLVAKIFHELKEEEEKHVGELQQCLQMVNDESQEHIEEGIQEAKDIIVEEMLEEQGEEGEESEGEELEGGMEKIFAEENKEETPAEDIFAEGNKEEDPEHKDKEEEPEEETPENVEAPEDNDDVKKEEESCGSVEQESCGSVEGEACEPYGTCESCDSFEDPSDDEDDNEDDDDDKDDDEDDADDKDDKDDVDDDEDDKDDDDNHEPDDVDDKEDDFGCGKESEFSTSLDPNAEPLNVDVDGQTMSQILEDATASIKAPKVVTNVEGMGAPTAELQKEIGDMESIIIEGDPDGTANEDGSPINPETVVKQPDDAQKERDKQFVSDVEPSTMNVEELLKKYNELEEKFNQLNNAAKMQEAEKLLQFGKDFINADEVVDEETKQLYIAQIEEKCKAYELNSEEEVTKFAKGLMAMYYYEHKAVHRESGSNEFTLSINKQARIDSNASNNKLKDAINKLNYLNKEE